MNVHLDRNRHRSTTPVDGEEAVGGGEETSSGADLWATNLRFGWLGRASTSLYVVYNEVRDIGRAGTGIPDRSLTVKYSRLFDLLDGSP